MRTRSTRQRDLSWPDTATIALALVGNSSQTASAEANKENKFALSVKRPVVVVAVFVLSSFWR